MKTRGYIVVIEEEGIGELTKIPFELGDSFWPKDGLLLDGTHATLFPDNQTAEAAIERTVRYGRLTQQTDWPQPSAYRVVPVVP